MVLLYEQAYGGNQIPEPFSAHNSTHRPNLAFITFLSLCTVKSKRKLLNEEINKVTIVRLNKRSQYTKTCFQRPPS